MTADRAHRLLSAFGSALSHSLRTPLSVITNDLTYLASLTDDPGVARSLGRCRGAAETLGKVRLPPPPSVVPHVEERAEVIRRAFSGGAGRGFPAATPEETFGAAAVEARIILEEKVFGRGAPYRTAERREPSGYVFSFESAAGGGGAAGVYLSLTDCLSAGHAGPDEIAPLVDAVFMSHGTSVSVVREGGVLVKISVRGDRA